jgi:hypothetical protein
MMYHHSIVRLDNLKDFLGGITHFKKLHSVVPLPGRFDTEAVLVITEQTPAEAKAEERWKARLRDNNEDG